jgi:perosamine synthetase
MTVAIHREALAIHGGTPVRSSMLPYARQSISESDIKAVVDVLRSDWLTTGPKVAEFEEAFASFVGARFAVSFSSGTAALHAATYTAGLGAGDEAITSPMTFVATANCVLYQGARPVFVDVCEDTLNIDTDQLAACLRPNTRAILPVDYAGHPADLGVIMELAGRHGLTVIEDASHALGSEYSGRRTGSIAHMTTFSFHPVKHVATGEGGMVTTDRAEFAEKLRCFRNHGISRNSREREMAGDWHYDVTVPGFNYRLSDVACVLGLEQLKRIDENLIRRRRIAARYASAFHGIKGLFLPVVRQDVTPAWHLYPIRLDLSRITTNRAQIFHALRAENIGVNVHYIPVHFHSYYRERFGHQPGEFPVAEDAYERLISLPMFHGMTDKDVNDVIEAVTKVMEHFAR